MQQELIIIDKTFFLQIISTRDKVSGLYLPTMDGNINVTLNRIYDAFIRGELSKVYISLPIAELIDSKSLNELYDINNLYFDGCIEFVHLDMYSLDVAKTRDAFCSTPDALYINQDVNQVVSDFAIQIRTRQECEIVYNYNWSKVSDDDITPSAKWFDKEVELSKHYKTYLYSDVQMNYWKSKDLAGDFVYRSKNIFNPQYIKRISNHHSTNTDLNDMRHEIESFIKHHKKVVYYYARIEDPRYDFESVAFFCKWSRIPLIIGNPTNVAFPDFLNGLEILDLTNAKNKRASYFMTLSSLRESDAIIHNENDMHISLIEQIMLTKADVIHNFKEETIQSYIKS